MALLSIFGLVGGYNGTAVGNTEFDAISGPPSLGSLAAVGEHPMMAHENNCLDTATGGSAGAAYGERDWGTDEPTTYSSFYIGWASRPSAVTSFYTLTDSTPNPIIDLRVSATGLWSVYNYGNTTTYTATPTGTAVLASKLYQVEVKLYCHASAGTIDVKIDGVLMAGISGITGINTRPGGDARRWRAGLTVSQTSAPHRYISNVIVKNDDWVGDAFVAGLKPREDISVANWSHADAQAYGYRWCTLGRHIWSTVSTGQYVYSNTPSAECVLGLAPFNPPTGTASVAILGVHPIIRAARSSAGSAASVTMCVRNGGVDGTMSAALDPASANLITKIGVLQTTDPATGAAWTVAGLNSAQIKMVKDAGANQINIAWMGIAVAFTIAQAGRQAQEAAADYGATAPYAGLHFGWAGYRHQGRRPLRGG